jgi:adenosylhomocysteine nucleosidase
MRSLVRAACAVLAAAALLVQAGCGTGPIAATAAADVVRLDPVPRIAVISAFQPELTLHVVVTGIAGGVNPGLSIGDVTVAARWGQYLETLAARETAPGRFQPPPWMQDATLPNFGLWHPRPVEVRSAARSESERKFWFDADAALLQVAQGLRGSLTLERCDADRRCLTKSPQLVVGGNGVSGSTFVDNAMLRDYAFRTFQANVLDMETAAIAHVAYANGVPYIAFRSLSDLAGGGEGANEMGTFLKIAADNSARVLLAFLAAWR